jgi:hypothetical protein
MLTGVNLAADHNGIPVFGYGFAAANGGNIGAVTARPITVTADNLSRSFGQPNRPLTFVVTMGSLVSGETLAGALATTASASSIAGLYPITQGSLVATPNYALTFIDGTLTVVALSNFGASAEKYLPAVTDAPTPQFGLTTCSPTALASALEHSGSVLLFGGSGSSCGGSL